MLLALDSRLRGSDDWKIYGFAQGFPYTVAPVAFVAVEIGSLEDFPFYETAAMTKTTSEVYESIYHYTNLQGLLGILETQSLWATHYKFLNDYSEGLLFRPKLIELIQPDVQKYFETTLEEHPQLKGRVEEKGGLACVVENKTIHLVSALCDNLPDHYIVSFSGPHNNDDIDNHGLLSQWRGYGRDGGFAIIFNTKTLEDLMRREVKENSYSVGHLSDVLYNHDDATYKDELSEHLPHITEYVIAMMDNLKSDGQSPLDAKKAYPSLVSCVTRHKHWGFKEENEVRLVVLPAVHNDKYKKICKKDGTKPRPEKKIKFREKNGEQVPYIEVFGFKNQKLPIERIIVGPHKEQERRVSMLKTKLRHTGITVTPSKIPYLG